MNSPRAVASFTRRVALRYSRTLTPGIMPKLANNSYLPSPRVRMFLVVGLAILASTAMVYIFLARPGSTLDFLNSHALPILVLASITGILSGWLQARDPRFRSGLFLRSAGKGLILFGAGAAFFQLPSAVTLSCLVLGFVSSLVGGMQARAARRRDMESQRQSGSI